MDVEQAVAAERARCAAVVAEAQRASLASAQHSHGDDPVNAVALAWLVVEVLKVVRRGIEHPDS